jgi:NDP-4-keto-2,6-dideoxyhexose 3-C-methyltransferase
MYTEISSCRLCGNTNLHKVFEMTDIALSGFFPNTQNVKVTSGPLTLVKCSGEMHCGLVQLRQTYPLEEMYGLNYGYRSSVNPSMAYHLREKVKKILDSGILKPNDLIVDIGSNDGTTLKNYGSEYELVGIDPSGSKFRKYYPPNIKLISDFFGKGSVNKYFNNKKAKIITSFSMFYDLEEPYAFASEVKSLLHLDGMWVFEQSYLPKMLSSLSFDTICHEHLEYYALRQIDWILSAVDLKIIDVEFNLINGGSFSISATHAGNNSHDNLASIPVSDLISLENSYKLDEFSTYLNFSANIENQKIKLLELLKKIREEEKTCYAIGASTKGNILLQHFGIDNSLVKAIGEINEDKFGCYTPGTEIPIIPEQDLLELRPDYLLILPWHFRDFFLTQEKFKGFNLIFPLPQFEVISVK